MMAHANKVLQNLKQGAEEVEDGELAERLRERAREIEEEHDIDGEEVCDGGGA